jgi:hypothetical protein
VDLLRVAVCFTHDAADRSGVLRRTVCHVGVRRFRRSGPTCRLPPLVHAPIDFRRRDRPPVEKNEICKSDRPGTFINGGSTSGLRSRLRSASRATPLSAEAILPWALPLAGLSVTRGVSRLFRASYRPGSTPVPDHQPPGGHVRRLHALPPWLPYPLMGFRQTRSLRFPRAICAAGPFSVLMGLMPVRPDLGLAPGSSGRLPV